MEPRLGHCNLSPRARCPGHKSSVKCQGFTTKNVVAEAWPQVVAVDAQTAQNYAEVGDPWPSHVSIDPENGWDSDQLGLWICG